MTDLDLYNDLISEDHVRDKSWQNSATLSEFVGSLQSRCASLEAEVEALNAHILRLETERSSLIAVKDQITDNFSRLGLACRREITKLKDRIRSLCPRAPKQEIEVNSALINRIGSNPEISPEKPIPFTDLVAYLHSGRTVKGSFVKDHVVSGQELFASKQSTTTQTDIASITRKCSTMSSDSSHGSHSSRSRSSSSTSSSSSSSSSDSQTNGTIIGQNKASTTESILHSSCNNSNLTEFMHSKTPPSSSNLELHSTQLRGSSEVTSRSYHEVASEKRNSPNLYSHFDQRPRHSDDNPSYPYLKQSEHGRGQVDTLHERNQPCTQSSSFSRSSMDHFRSERRHDKIRHGELISRHRRGSHRTLDPHFFKKGWQQVPSSHACHHPEVSSTRVHPSVSREDRHILSRCSEKQLDRRTIEICDSGTGFDSSNSDFIRRQLLKAVEISTRQARDHHSIRNELASGRNQIVRSNVAISCSHREPRVDRTSDVLFTSKHSKFDSTLYSQRRRSKIGGNERTLHSSNCNVHNSGCDSSGTRRHSEECMANEGTKTAKEFSIDDKPECPEHLTNETQLQSGANEYQKSSWDVALDAEELSSANHANKELDLDCQTVLGLTPPITSMDCSDVGDTNEFDKANLTLDGQSSTCMNTDTIRPPHSAQPGGDGEHSLQQSVVLENKEEGEVADDYDEEEEDVTKPDNATSPADGISLKRPWTSNSSSPLLKLAKVSDESQVYKSGSSSRLLTTYRTSPGLKSPLDNVRSEFRETKVPPHNWNKSNSQCSSSGVLDANYHRLLKHDNRSSSSVRKHNEFSHTPNRHHSKSPRNSDRIPTETNRGRMGSPNRRLSTVSREYNSNRNRTHYQHPASRSVHTRPFRENFVQGHKTRRVNLSDQQRTNIRPVSPRRNKILSYRERQNRFSRNNDRSRVSSPVHKNTYGRIRLASKTSSSRFNRIHRRY